MKRIVVLGAGRSATVLIEYLLSESQNNDWEVTVADQDVLLAQSKINGHSRGLAIDFNIEKEPEKLANYDLVISLLPPWLHIIAAEACVEFGKPLITASYANEAIRQLDAGAKARSVLILMECGLDPGIDHMSAMQIIHRIKAEGGNILSFKSFCGGLIAPESDNNPWNYKITWNPRNVVLAGQGGAVKYLENGTFKYIPYHKLFERTEKVEVADIAEFEAYANRDSLAYREIYGLDESHTLLRGTLRYKGFSRAWNILVQLGLTDDTFRISNSQNMTYKEFLTLFLPDNDNSLFYSLLDYLDMAQSDPAIQKFQWLGLLENQKIGIANASPAQILQHLIETKWKLEATDKDMVLMKHQFIYKLGERQKRLDASLVVYGKNQSETAMAKTVGLPLGIAAKLVLTGRYKEKGVRLPVDSSLYEPLLTELANYNIKFNEILM